MKSILSSLIILALWLSPDHLLAEESPGMKYWNGIKKTAHVTDSGLQYKIRTLGDGPKPAPGSKVRVHYRGMLLDGRVFDHSYNEDEPLSLSLKRVIDGWKEGIPLMPEDSVFTFLIPPELGYGVKGSRGIPPDSTLIFDVELYGR